MSHDSTTEASTDNFWPELTADTTFTRSVPRSVTLDTIRSSSDGRLLEVSSQLDLIRTRLNSLEQFVLEAPLNSTVDANVQKRIAEMELSIASTSSRFDELANRLVESDETVASTVVKSVDGFDTRIALIEDARLAQSRELNELTGYLEQAFTRITELAEIIETNNEQHNSRITDVEGQLEGTQTRASLSALESAIADIDKRSEEAKTSLHARLADMQEAATAPLVELQSRVSAHGDQLEQHREQIRGQQTRLSEQSERLDKHEEELGIQYQDIAKLHEFQAATVTTFEDQTSTLDVHTTQIETQAETLDTHTTQIETQAETLDTHTTQIETHDHEIAEIRSRLTEAPGGDTSAIEADLEAATSRVSEVESATRELRSELTSETESLRDEMTSLSERINGFESIETTSTAHTDDERVNEVAASVQETHQLAESLRVIQTQVVQTIQGELNTHEDRLAELERSQSEALEAHEGFASSERLEQLETKLVEALQTISQLTQLQRRHTGVETQLADALSASNQGIEHTQQHVVLLRSELEKANARIANLEQALTAATGQRIPVAEPAATPPPVPPTPATAQTAPDAPAIDLDTAPDSVDTDWFDESFDQRRAS